MFFFFFSHSRSNVFGLKFHHVLIRFYVSFLSVCFYKCMFCQMCVFATFGFAKCYFIFFVKFILVGDFIIFGTIFVVLVKEARLVITLDDLDFGIKDFTFEAKVFNRYGTFDQILNKSMKDLGYAYLHYDLLNMVTLTIITLKVKSSHIKMYE